MNTILHIWLSLLVICISSIERPVTLLKQRQTKLLLTKEWEYPNKISDIRHLLSKYDSFVPVIGRNTSYLDVRRDMFTQGVYPGVEYRILDIRLESNGESISSLISLINKTDNINTPFITSKNIDIDNNYNNDDNDNIVIKDINDIVLFVRPVYPLIDELERQWPVSLKLHQVPFFLTRGMYNSITVMGSLVLSISFFISCFILSNMFTLSFVNSKSMESTISPKDLILVEKISPIIRRDLLHINSAQDGDVIFFQQPPKLVEYIKKQESKDINKARRKTLSSDLIVKRVNSVVIQNHHRYYDVRGDNPDYSVDSRTFGLLDEKYLIGHPLLRIFPFQRIGLLDMKK